MNLKVCCICELQSRKSTLLYIAIDCRNLSFLIAIDLQSYIDLENIPPPILSTTPSHLGWTYCNSKHLTSYYYHYYTCDQGILSKKREHFLKDAKTVRIMIVYNKAHWESILHEEVAANPQEKMKHWTENLKKKYSQMEFHMTAGIPCNYRNPTVYPRRWSLDKRHTVSAFDRLSQDYNKGNS